MKTNKLTHLEDEIKSMERYAESINERVYTSGQVAKFMGASRLTVNRLFDKGILKGSRNPETQHRRFSREYLLQFIVDTEFEHAFKNYQNHLIEKGYVPTDCLTD